MKKNFRFGFSYIELVFAMAIVVMLLAISAPFLTRKKFATGASYGEYQCWAVYKCGAGETGEQCWHLYERSRYNTADFDNEDGRRVDTCKFLKPIGANEYELTLVSGGGGGSMAEFPSNIYSATMGGAEIVDAVREQDEEGQIMPKNFTYNGNSYTSYQIVNRKYQLRVNPGIGGEPGNVISFKSALKSFDDDAEIKINLCNSGENNLFETRNEYDEAIANNTYCVGKGGKGAEYRAEGMGITYKGRNLVEYYELLEIYNKKIFGEFGAGNLAFATHDAFGAGNDCEILRQYFPEELPPETCFGNSSEIGRISKEDMLVKLRSLFNQDNNTGINTGFIGGYTHFITNSNDENMYCRGGNCIVPGGMYGKTSAPNAFKNIFPSDKRGHDYYCYGTGFSSISAGEYKNSIAQEGNKVVIIGNPKEENVEFKSGTINNFDVRNTVSITLNDDNTKEIDKVSENSLNKIGSGGGGGGFTFRTSFEPHCTYLKLIQPSGAETKVFTDSASYDSLDEGLKNQITCSSDFSSGITLKRTNGGRGSGGAIIIKW